MEEISQSGLEPFMMESFASQKALLQGDELLPILRHELTHAY